jgi:hypothetical protein
MTLNPDHRPLWPGGPASTNWDMELDHRDAELPFQLLTEREEKSRVAIDSNESFSWWTKTFTDPRLCAAIVDWLTVGGNIIETGTASATP